MVRTKTHKLIVYPQIQRIQVFDIDNDPWEMHDLSNDPAAAGVKADLMQRLKRMQVELDDKVNLEHPVYEPDETLKPYFDVYEPETRRAEADASR